MQLRDPSTQKGMNVNENGQGEVRSVSVEEIHWFSRNKRTAYSVQGQTDTLTAAKVPVLYIKNTSSDKDLILFSIYGQTIAEAATLPAVGIYWSIDFNAAVSGGTAGAIRNENTGSTKAPAATVLQSTPTIDTAGIETIRIYPKLDGEIIPFANGEATIIAPNGSWLLSYLTTGSAGIANAWAYFYMRPVVE